MLGDALASILKSQLGQYLDTEDLDVSVSVLGGKPIVLTNVKLRESVFREANLPLRWGLLLLPAPWGILLRSVARVIEAYQT